MNWCVVLLCVCISRVCPHYVCLRSMLSSNRLYWRLQAHLTISITLGNTEKQSKQAAVWFSLVCACECSPLTQILCLYSGHWLVPLAWWLVCVGSRHVCVLFVGWAVEWAFVQGVWTGPGWLRCSVGLLLIMIVKQDALIAHRGLGQNYWSMGESAM